MKLRRIALALAGVFAIATAAYAAGVSTNGLPTIVATTVNGVAQSAPLGIYTQLSATSPLVAVDTNLPSGQNPQSVAASPFQIAAISAEIAGSTATSTAGAATSNTRAGTITTESLSTAPGATYSFVLTNSLITATGPVPQVAMYSKSNTGGAIQVQSITNGSGSATIVFKNVGTTAFNGTMLIAFHI